MELNEIIYGNPNKNQLLYLTAETFLDSLLPELKSFPPNSNDDENTATELELIKTHVTVLSQTTDDITKALTYDASFEKYIVEKLGEYDSVEQDIVELHKDIMPLCMKLKFNYGRIRPFQLASLKKLDLVPFKSYTSDSPSYPSAHAFQAKVYAEVLGNKYPKFYRALQTLAEDIAKSRTHLGVNYPSDVEFGIYCADVVLNHPDFRKKYKL